MDLQSSRIGDIDNVHLLDVDYILDKIVEADLDPTVFTEDSNIPYARNVIEFALDPRFLGTSLWAKQAEQAVRLFAEWCPSCTNMDFFDDVPVEANMATFKREVCLLNDGVCPKCGKNKKELFDELPQELVACLGQRSGKTALTGGVITPYYVHRFLKIPNPTRYYRLMKSSSFHITFVAVTATQAQESIWAAFKGAIDNSPWFVDYMSRLRKKEKEQGLEKGTLIKNLDTMVVFGHKKLAISFAAADMKSLRGRTRVIGGIDELAWMSSNANAKRANPDETYASLSNSLRTIRSAADMLWAEGDYNALPAFMLNFSSPSSSFDKIMRLLKDGEVDKRKICFHLASWEASPLITRKSLASDEATDNMKFWRDFGAQPPLANSPFIDSKDAIEKMHHSNPPLLRWKHVIVKDKINPDMNYVAAEIGSFTKDKSTPRVISVDGGESQNSFCINVMRLETTDEGSFSIIQDVIIEAKPEKVETTGELRPVHFPTMFNIILALCDPLTGLNVKAVLYDRWQSTGEIQRLREMEIHAERYSPKPDDFKLIRNLVLQGQFKTPKRELEDLIDFDPSKISDIRAYPYTHQAIQFATVRKVGLKVIKPEVGEDDLFRASVLGARYLIDNRKDFETKTVHVLPHSSTARVGVMRGKTTGSYYGTSMITSIGSVKRKSRK